MLRSILMDKWKLLGIAFLILFGIACVLWYQWDTANFKRKIASDTKAFVRANDAPKTDHVQNTGLFNDTEPHKPALEANPISERTSELHTDMTVNTLQDDMLTELDEVLSEFGIPAKERVSLNGLGPYPKTPDGYPYSPLFTPDMSLEDELVERVRIKLFRDKGVFATGIGFDGKTGLIQYVTEHQLYADWKYNTDDYGKPIKYVSSLTADPDTVMQIFENARNRDPNFMEGDLIFESDIPRHVTILSHSDGVDPYSYLNLSK